MSFSLITRDLILVDSLIDSLIDQKGKVEVSKSQNIRRVGTHEEMKKKVLIKFNSIRLNSLQFLCIRIVNLDS